MFPPEVFELEKAPEECRWVNDIWLMIEYLD